MNLHNIEAFRILSFLHLQVHTEDLQDKAMTSLFTLVCSMYKVNMMSFKSKPFIEAMFSTCVFFSMIV